jgi:sterol desaturase/sphingolipid hydroxylase (fatty acid hydroxylase superfamily)
MLLVPCHYPTHFGLLFFTAIWATYIHDAMDLNVWPVMGSKYHTIHHTHYIYNYGQVFVFCDVLWGTFREPSGPTGVVSSSPAAADGSRARAPTRARPVTSRVGGGKGKRS